MADLFFSSSLLDFSATTVDVEAGTDAGRALLGDVFGRGAASATLSKTGAADFKVFAERKGLTTEIRS